MPVQVSCGPEKVNHLPAGLVSSEVMFALQLRDRSVFAIQMMEWLNDVPLPEVSGTLLHIADVVPHRRPVW